MQSVLYKEIRFLRSLLDFQRARTIVETKNTYSALRYVAANECLLSFSIEIVTFTQFLSVSRVSEVHCHNMPYGGSGKNSDTYNQNALEEATRSGPYFDKSASKNVTALLGKTTYLNCRVKNLGNKTVSEINTYSQKRESVLFAEISSTYLYPKRITI